MFFALAVGTPALLVALQWLGSNCICYQRQLFSDEPSIKDTSDLAGEALPTPTNVDGVSVIITLLVGLLLVALVGLVIARGGFTHPVANHITAASTLLDEDEGLFQYEDPPILYVVEEKAMHMPANFW